MAITLLGFSVGDTDYISRLNQNNTVLKDAIDALQASLSGSNDNQVALAALTSSMFVGITALGLGSYDYTAVGDSLMVAPGSVWMPEAGQILHSIATVDLDFTGRAAGTYYIELDVEGIPTIASTPTEPLYTVVWTGSAFGDITKIEERFFTFGVSGSSSGAVSHGFRAEFGEPSGADLAAGLVCYIDDLPYGGTINEYTLGVSPSGASATIEVWMIGTPSTARPTVANVINTAGVSISSGGRVRSTVLTDFTTLVIPAGAAVAINLKSVTGAKQVNFSVEMS